MEEESTMRYTPAVLVLLVVAMIVVAAGCGDSKESAVEGLTEKAEGLAETAGEMADEVMDMAPEDMEAKVEEIKKQIEEKKELVAEIAEKLKNLSPSDLTGDGAKNLESERDDLTKEIADLEKKTETYTKKLTD
jgi:archaellum component FlaC